MGVKFAVCRVQEMICALFSVQRVNCAVCRGNVVQCACVQLDVICGQCAVDSIHSPLNVDGSAL